MAANPSGGSDRCAYRGCDFPRDKHPAFVHEPGRSLRPHAFVPPPESRSVQGTCECPESRGYTANPLLCKGCNRPRRFPPSPPVADSPKGTGEAIEVTAAGRRASRDGVKANLGDVGEAIVKLGGDDSLMDAVFDAVDNLQWQAHEAGRSEGLRAAQDALVNRSCTCARTIAAIPGSDT